MFKLKLVQLELPDKIPDKLPKIKPDSPQDKLLNFGRLTVRAGYGSASTASHVRRLSALNNQFVQSDKRSWPLVSSLNTRVYCIDIDSKYSDEIEKIRDSLEAIPNAFLFDSFSGRPKALVTLSDPCLTDAEAIEEISALTGISQSTFSCGIDSAGLNAFYVHPRRLIDLTNWIKANELDKVNISKRLVEGLATKQATPYPLPPSWDNIPYLSETTSNEIIRDFVVDFLTQYGQSNISSHKLSATLQINQRICSRVLKQLVDDGTIELVDAEVSIGRKARTYRLPGINVLPRTKEALKTPPRRLNESIYAWTNKLIRYAAQNDWDFDQLAKHVELELGSEFDPTKLNSLKARWQNWLKKKL